MKVLFHIVLFLMLISLIIIYINYVNYYGHLIWFQGILLFAGLGFNWYLFSNLFNKLSKHKQDKND